MLLAPSASLFQPFHQFAAELHEHREPLAFVRYLLAGLHRLIPSDYNSWKEISGTGRARVAAVFLPQNPQATALLSAFQRHVGDHPVCNYWRQSGEHHIASRWSDVLSRPEIERLPLHEEFYRPLGIRHQMMVALEARPSQLIYVALNRSRNPFTDEERALLTALQPHAAHALRQAHDRHRLQSTITSLSTFVDTLSQGVVCLSPDFQIRWASKRARHYLHTHLGWAPNTARLPDALHQWLVKFQQHPGEVPRTLSIRSQTGCLIARIMKERQTLYLFLEDTEQQGRFDALKILGLTGREAEVLGCVASGKSNEEVAAILGIGTQTVKKHLERIYSALGVSNRTEAALKAQSALRGSIS